MRNFSFNRFGASSIVVLTALVGCGNPPHLVDGGHGRTDSGNPVVDMGMSLVDTGVIPPDTGNMTGADGGSACTYNGGCDLTNPSSCPADSAGARQGCYPDDGAPACHPAGTAVAGASCGSAGDCDAGFVCLGTGECAKLCCSAANCTTGDVCNPLGSATTMMVLPNGVGYCHRPAACSPIPSSGCPAGRSCTTRSADGTTDCVTTGTVGEGGDCSGGNCADGLGCFTSTPHPAGICLRFCRRAMGNTDCTGTATTCNPGLGTTYGLCE